MEGITGISTPLGLKLAVLYVFIFLAALYSYTVVHQRRIGWSRVMWAAPVVSGCLLLPLLLDPFSGAEATLITPLVSVSHLGFAASPASNLCVT